jgi:GDP-4-dehydro-6-deoxy-D-mannose reductase
MSTCRVLITGASGFTGRHLAARLARTATAGLIGLDLDPVSLRESSKMVGLAALDPPHCLYDFLPCDLTDPEAARQAVERADPDVVFHLAGIFGADSPEEIQRVNVGGFVCLRDALRRQAGHRQRPIRLLVVGSAAELGIAGAVRLPVAEDACCQPETAYGRSKWEVTRLALAEPADGPLEIVVARPFNLVGPGLSPRLALGSFARQIADVALGRADAIRCGSLDARRDYLDVRDAVEAYRLLVERGRPGQLYHVCAGRSHAIGDLLHRMLGLAGVRAAILSHPTDRAGDLADIFGDPGKIAAECGWTARIDIGRSLGDLVAWAIADRPPSGTPDGWGVESSQGDESVDGQLPRDLPGPPTLREPPGRGCPE